MSLRGVKCRDNLRGNVVLNSSLVILYIIAGLSLMGIVLRIEAEGLPVNRYGLIKNLIVHHVITRSEATW